MGNDSCDLEQEPLRRQVIKKVFDHSMVAYLEWSTPHVLATFVLKVPCFYSQGFTQKHPKLLHLKTNPGPQVITEVLVEGMDEVRELPVYCP